MPIARQREIFQHFAHMETSYTGRCNRLHFTPAMLWLTVSLHSVIDYQG